MNKTYNVQMTDLHYVRNFNTRFKKRLVKKDEFEKVFEAKDFNELCKIVVAESKKRLKEDKNLVAVHSLVTENNFEFYIDRPYLAIKNTV